MAIPTFTMRQLLEAGVHFGHRTGRWNPKMAPYIYGERNGVHIIDLQQTVPMLYAALKAVRDVVAGGGRVLMVGTKHQAAAKVAESGRRCGQYYVNHRWLGGMMTNWNTVTDSVKRLKSLEEQLEGDQGTGLTKKELLQLTRERDKLDRALGGIKEMGALPDILFVIDTNKEDIAVAEARKLSIPVAAVVDSNSDPDGINFPIPGNDDAIRAIDLYCDLMADAVLDGIQEEMAARGVDIGASEKAPAEERAAVAAGGEAGAQDVPAGEPAANGPGEAPEEVPGESPGEAPEGTPEEVPAETPEEVPVPAEVPEETPKETPEETPAGDADDSGADKKDGS